MEACAGGKVSLVPTPIGNREDMTLRALRVLREADLIACEDTRHSAPLLAHYEISGKSLVALHEHNEQRKIPELIEAVLSGKHLAVVTDAGMPSVSDPGYRLVQACLAAGVELEVLPGPSAVLTALVGSGMPCHAFRFGGFLPVKSGRRRQALVDGLRSGETAIFFESPHRLVGTLGILAELAPGARVCVARELTKKFETYHRGSASEVAEHFSRQAPKGEIVLLFCGDGEVVEEEEISHA